ncbi:MAG: TrkA family potassium uptake protein [Candidatus Methanoperedenaceae archaeon]|nr:TrkA family potassium uptake protein [Candidatus Methanoperedenaceae archaeon]
MRKHIILVGFGDVGSRIAKVLKDAGAIFVVVDRNEAKLKDKDFEYVAGDATDENVLKQAGLEKASSVIIVMNDDNDIIFTTLIARNINPHSVIIARANALQSIDKIYRAGADYVASLSILAGQMLAKIILGNEDETIMMFQGLEIERYPVTPGSRLSGKTIAESQLRSRMGCTVIGIEENGKTTTYINPEMVMKEGMTLAVIGNREQISRFQQEYKT